MYRLRRIVTSTLCNEDCTRINTCEALSTEPRAMVTYLIHKANVENLGSLNYEKFKSGLEQSKIVC